MTSERKELTGNMKEWEKVAAKHFIKEMIESLNRYGHDVSDVSLVKGDRKKMIDETRNYLKSLPDKIDKENMNYLDVYKGVDKQLQKLRDDASKVTNRLTGKNVRISVLACFDSYRPAEMIKVSKADSKSDSKNEIDNDYKNVFAFIRELKHFFEENKEKLLKKSSGSQFKIHSNAIKVIGESKADKDVFTTLELILNEVTKENAANKNLFIVEGRLDHSFLFAVHEAIKHIPKDEVHSGKWAAIDIQQLKEDLKLAKGLESHIKLER